MSVPRVPIAPPVLEWALARTGLSPADLERRFPKVEKWKSGELRPTLSQAKLLAQTAHIPFGRLLLDEPSGGELDVADFRTVRNAAIESMSSDLEETLRANQDRLAWYSEFAIEEGVDPPEIFGSVAPNTPAALAASEIREKLGLDTSGPVPGPDRVRELAILIERSGVLVARNSIVKDSTRRPLSVEEFRGFTIADEGFALVFVNTRDAKSAQLFSLAHELGHVVLGQPGISDHSEQLELERWCNRFASEFLAPAADVVSLHDVNDVLASVSKLSSRFGLSREAMLWRLVELELVTRAEASDVVNKVKTGGSGREDGAGGAPPRHILVRSRVGGLFFDTVTRAVTNGQIPEREAARYLGAKNHESLTKLLDVHHPEAV